MRSSFSLPPFALFLAIALPAARAQAGPDIYVTPIPNVPFVAIVNVQRTIVQKDGSITTFKSTRGISRDRQGRIYNELRALIPPTSTEIPQLVSVHLYDPATRVSTMLYPNNRTFRTFTVNRPPLTEPPALTEAAPSAARQPQNEFVKEEDLGVREIEGVQAHGVRDTQSIPPTSSPSTAAISTKPVLVTDEFWYSPDLHMNLVIKHKDPRTGSVTLTVSNVSRTEPDPALFEIPEGYTKAGPRQAPFQ